MRSAICVCRGPEPRAVLERCTGDPRRSLVSARRASMLGTNTPNPTEGGGRTEPPWLIYMRPTVKREASATSHQVGEETGVGRASGQPRLRPLRRSYKMVLNKLRLWAPPSTYSRDPRFLKEVVGTLLPGATSEGDGWFTDVEGQEPQLPEEEPRHTAGSWSPESRFTVEELALAVGRIRARKAPGPDGVPARLWKDVAGVLTPRLMRVFDRCLYRGEFSVLWNWTRPSPIGRCVFCTGQATGECGGGPSRVAFVPECSRTARQPVWFPEVTAYGRHCSPCPLTG